jgi:hypothetical protein
MYSTIPVFGLRQKKYDEPHNDSHIFPKGFEPGTYLIYDYRLKTGVRSSAEAKDSFSSLFLQTSTGDNSASNLMGIVGPFTKVKRGRGVTLTTHPT